MAVDKNVLLKNKELLKYDKYQEFFDKLPESERSAYAEFFYFDVGIDFLKHMYTIPDSLFLGCSKLKQVKLDVDSVGKNAFAGTGLVEVLIGKGCNSIGQAAFAGNANLVSVVIEDGPRVIAKETFMECPLLKKVYIPKSVTVLQKDAFKEDNNVQIITPMDRVRQERLTIPQAEKDFYREHMRKPKAQVNSGE